ncbi:hypothetical protein MML48_9g00015142 [Holotrichia oblita]|uniref:Uncharacterized protein n=1 Tax=Holotrichia oblita TaxID=644536 RepID=A0ACB9SLN0_HOLOL|nr:hypothetical protein MML48_9g00015142 [Holotrichia oblita]
MFMCEFLRLDTDKIIASKDPNVWLKWLEKEGTEQNIDNEEIVAEDESEVENEIIGTRNEDSDPEQEMDYIAEESNEDATSARGLFYLGKNKTTRWNKIELPTSRTRSHNLIPKAPGPQGDAKGAKTSMESFN